jgi:CHRD domain
MKRRTWLWTGVIAVGAATLLGAASSTAAVADDVHVQNIVFERLTGFQEDPLTFSTPGTATFAATIDDRNQQINFRLSYKDLPTAVLQAHIHFGGPRQSGGVAAFLCTNLGNGPADTQACPAGDATITGTITAADVVGPTAQGINAGDFAALVRAIRAGATYANIHTVQRQGGEIRAQISNGDD